MGRYSEDEEGDDSFIGSLRPKYPLRTQNTHSIDEDVPPFAKVGGTTIILLGIALSYYITYNAGYKQGWKENNVQRALKVEYDQRYHFGVPFNGGSQVAAEHYGEQADAFMRGIVPENDTCYNTHAELERLANEGKALRSTIYYPSED